MNTFPTQLDQNVTSCLRAEGREGGQNLLMGSWQWNEGNSEVWMAVKGLLVSSKLGARSDETGGEWGDAGLRQFVLIREPTAAKKRTDLKFDSSCMIRIVAKCGWFN